MINRQPRFKFASFVLPSIIALTSLQAHAAHFSDLVIVQEAAQTGLWTSVLSGTMPDGSTAPKKTETMCATKAEILQNFNHAMYYDTKTGQEQKECPTKLTTNTSTLGVATMTCPAQTVVAAGKTFKIPSFTAIGEFKRINKQQWTIRYDKMISTVTYHGSASASCIKNRK
jgi:hypothetical protein